MTTEDIIIHVFCLVEDVMPDIEVNETFHKEEQCIIVKATSCQGARTMSTILTSLTENQFDASVRTLSDQMRLTR